MSHNRTVPSDDPEPSREPFSPIRASIKESLTKFMVMFVQRRLAVKIYGVFEAALRGG